MKKIRTRLSINGSTGIDPYPILSLGFSLVLLVLFIVYRRAIVGDPQLFGFAAALIGAVLGGVLGGLGSYYGGINGGRHSFMLLDHAEETRSVKRISTIVKYVDSLFFGHRGKDVGVVVYSSPIYDAEWPRDIGLISRLDSSDRLALVRWIQATQKLYIESDPVDLGSRDGRLMRFTHIDQALANDRAAVSAIIRSLEEAYLDEAKGEAGKQK